MFVSIGREIAFIAYCLRGTTSYIYVTSHVDLAIVKSVFF